MTWWGFNFKTAFRQTDRLTEPSQSLWRKCYEPVRRLGLDIAHVVETQRSSCLPTEMSGSLRVTLTKRTWYRVQHNHAITFLLITLPELRRTNKRHENIYNWTPLTLWPLRFSLSWRQLLGVISSACVLLQTSFRLHVGSVLSSTNHFTAQLVWWGSPASDDSCKD